VKDDWSLSRAGHDPAMLDLQRYRDKTVIDAGSGPQGAFVFELREAKANAFAVDRAQFERRESFLIKADLRRMPFEDGSVDHIFSTSSVLSYRTWQSVKLEALREFTRVLKLGHQISLAPVDPFEIQELVARVPELRIQRVYFDDASDGHGVTLQKIAPDDPLRLVPPEIVEIGKPSVFGLVQRDPRLAGLLGDSKRPVTSLGPEDIALLYRVAQRAQMGEVKLGLWFPRRRTRTIRGLLKDMTSDYMTHVVKVYGLAHMREQMQPR
jgi:hypothetical protein